MDDKLHEKSEEKLRSLLLLTEEFSNDIRMNFGIEKCCIQNIRKAKLHAPRGDRSYVDYRLWSRKMLLTNTGMEHKKIVKGMLYFVILWYKLPTIPLQIFA